MNFVELQLVVAIRLRRWRQCVLGLPFLRLVLYERVHLGTAVFQLQFSRLYGLWVIDRDRGVSDGIFLREAHLWVSGYFCSLIRTSTH